MIQLSRPGWGETEVRPLCRAFPPKVLGKLVASFPGVGTLSGPEPHWLGKRDDAGRMLSSNFFSVAEVS